MSSSVWQLVKQRQEECTVSFITVVGVIILARVDSSIYIPQIREGGGDRDKGRGRKWKWKQRRFLIIFLFGCDNGNANFIWCNHALALAVSPTTYTVPAGSPVTPLVCTVCQYLHATHTHIHTYIRRERQRFSCRFLILLTLSEYNLLLSDWISSSSSLLLLFFVLNIYFNLISHFTICQRALSLGYTWLKKEKRIYCLLFLSFSTFYCPNCDIIFPAKSRRAGQFELALINEPVVMPGSNASPSHGILLLNSIKSLSSFT